MNPIVVIMLHRRMPGISPVEAIAKVFGQMPRGTVFSVKFNKRTDGAERHMRCRFGVKSHLKGGRLAYNPLEKALFTVFDMDKRAYRSIPWEGITELKVAGQTYQVSQ